MLLALLVLAILVAVLAVPLALRAVRDERRRRSRRRARRLERLGRPVDFPDPGRERRAEQRARELLRSCVNDEEWAMYRDLGFIRVHGRPRKAGERQAGASADADGPPSYAYLIYPHKPVVSYVPETGRLLSEYCVEFPDLSGALNQAKLPASDDVLAKWMALTGDERRLIGDANMHLPGRQVEPARVRRDLWRLGQWEQERRSRGSAQGSRRA